MVRHRTLAATAALWMAVSAWQTGGDRVSGLGRSAFGAQSAPPSSAPSPGAPRAGNALVNQSCVTCHNQRLKTGGLALDTPDLSNVAAHAAVWEKVIRKVRAGMMPPAGVPRPDAAARQALVSSLESTLDAAARARPNPGRPLAHRLNRAEYANAVRDLLALDVDVTSMLPPDDSSGGFDNNADVLGVSPVLLESYLTAAERISALAIGDPATPPNGELFRVGRTRRRTATSKACRSARWAAFESRPRCRWTASISSRCACSAPTSGRCAGSSIHMSSRISVDGERVHLAAFGGDKEIAASSDNPTTIGDAVDGRFTARVPLKAGPRTIAVAFIEKTHALNTRRLESSSAAPRTRFDFSGGPHIDEVILTGPFKPTGAGDTPSRKANIRVPAEDGRRGRAVRAADSVGAGAARV